MKYLWYRDIMQKDGVDADGIRQNYQNMYNCKQNVYPSNIKVNIT